mmetsp:Transcript_109866/g.309865  ORF Transcript_109866/g.309865 Transcript_109866/m.309865 type:complete len:293 (-) Transcript_109866:399-1277(-)
MLHPRPEAGSVQTQAATSARAAHGDALIVDGTEIGCLLRRRLLAREVLCLLRRGSLRMPAGPPFEGLERLLRLRHVGAEQRERENVACELAPMVVVCHSNLLNNHTFLDAAEPTLAQNDVALLQTQTHESPRCEQVRLCWLGGRENDLDDSQDLLRVIGKVVLRSEGIDIRPLGLRAVELGVVKILEVASEGRGAAAPLQDLAVLGPRLCALLSVDHPEALEVIGSLDICEADDRSQWITEAWVNEQRFLREVDKNDDVSGLRRVAFRRCDPCEPEPCAGPELSEQPQEWRV